MSPRVLGKREQAIKLRKRGKSLRFIAHKLNIPKSTLSGWLKNISLTRKQEAALKRSWKDALIYARKKAVVWHNVERQKRLNLAEDEARKTIDNIDVKNRYVLDLALAMLYFGEGIKKNSETGLGNSDPLILKMFLYVLKRNYRVDVNKIRAELYLRADQDVQKMKKFWSGELGLPIENFRYAHLDKRTQGSKTYRGYHGVCLLRCGNVAIQRKLINISKEFFERVVRDAPIAQ